MAIHHHQYIDPKALQAAQVRSELEIRGLVRPGAPGPATAPKSWPAAHIVRAVQILHFAGVRHA